jgi:hypothetical protein
LHPFARVSYRWRAHHEHNIRTPRKAMNAPAGTPPARGHSDARLPRPPSSARCLCRGGVGTRPGSPPTRSPPHSPRRDQPAYLVCLDMRRVVEHRKYRATTNAGTRPAAASPASRWS